MSALETFKREVRIATSRRAQPVWFRILKWAIAIGISAILWRTPHFIWWIFGAVGLSVILHFFGAGGPKAGRSHGADGTTFKHSEVTSMRFAKVVFRVAGIWGIVVLTPLYFLIDLTGRRYAAPVDYPQFFYGFLSVALAWQLAFLLIGSSPARFRPLMIPSVVEKLGHVAGVAVLYGQGRLSAADATAAAPDLVLGVLFIVAFAVTPKFPLAGWSTQPTRC